VLNGQAGDQRQRGGKSELFHGGLESKRDEDARAKGAANAMDATSKATHVPSQSTHAPRAEIHAQTPFGSAQHTYRARELAAIDRPRDTRRECAVPDS
jgi:hypothetical protein